MFKKIVTSIFILILVSCGETQPTQINDIHKTSVTWDTWGIPHIKAEGEIAAAYGFGWAQMKSHTNLLAELYGTARGRAAEYWGEDFLESDKFLRTMGLPMRAPDIFKAQSPKYQKVLTAFTDGMNAYAKAHPEELDEDKAQVLPFTPEDVLAHIQNSLHLTFVSRGSQSRAQQWKKAGEKPGSNAWAISPQKSASGNAMLLANPHLPWDGLFYFYEAHITTDNMNTYGTALIGWPALVIAFNDNLGWTHTVNTYDGEDIYELSLSGDGYTFGGDVKEFEKRLETITIKEDDGSFRTESLEILSSIHGPVISKKKGKALAIKVAGLDELNHSSLTEQYWKAGSAKTLDEFESALSGINGPMFNTIYADKAGNIFYEFNALQPIRAKGNVAFWSGIIDGADPELLWRGYRTYEELPKFKNPESGFIQNSNDPPWTSTFPQVLKVEDYPNDFAPEFMHFRAQSGAGMLLGDDSITYDELIDYRGSNRLRLADVVLPSLIEGAKDSDDPLLQEAARVLENWDRNTNADSVGAVLFQAWAMKNPGAIFTSTLFKEKWDPTRPMDTPVGLKNIPASLEILKTVSNETIENFGQLDVPWGEAVRIKYNGYDLPASTGPGFLGAFRVAFLQPEENGRYTVQGGNSYVAAIEFGDRIKANGILAYGNSTQLSSKHFGDQLELFSKGAFRPIWFYPEDIKENIEEVDDLNYMP